MESSALYGREQMFMGVVHINSNPQEREKKHPIFDYNVTSLHLTELLGEEKAWDSNFPP